MVKNFEFKVLPDDILRCERVYPGLLDDIITHLNYRHLIKEQSEAD